MPKIGSLFGKISRLASSGPSGERRAHGGSVNAG